VLRIFDVGREILRGIAIVTMTIDHIGAILLPDQIPLRVVGRLAFPIFCYLLVLGVESTKKIGHYVIRLCTFALISQVPYFFAFGINPFDRLNILFTLLFGAFMLYLYEKRSPLVIVPVLVSVLLNSEGGIYGIALVWCMKVFKENTGFGILTLLVLGAFSLFSEAFQVVFLATLPLVMLHKDGWLRKEIETTKHSIYFSWRKYVFYIYYPLHLALLYMIKLSCF